MAVKALKTKSQNGVLNLIQVRRFGFAQWLKPALGL